MLTARHSPSRRRAIRFGILAAASAAALLAVSACTQTQNDVPPPSPVTVEELAQGVVQEPLEVETDVEVDGTDQVNFRKITLAPGGGTGRHCHYGNLIAVVGAGSLTHYAPIYPGGVHEYHEGDTIIEGPGYVHEGKNEGEDTVVLWVTYVTPEGKPLAETDLAHCEAQ